MKSIQAISYPVHFEKDSYKKLLKLIKKNNYSSIFLLVDENTKLHCYPKFIEVLQPLDTKFKLIEIASGEENKTLETCIEVWKKITNLGGDRHSLLITLGGGVITDLGGFSASCFKRGIDFVNIPTTLLSMVDASVGGKTGVDLGALKNQIGLFSNPKMVIVDSNYLETLSEREIKSGTAEILKYGLIYDSNLFDNIFDNKIKDIEKLIFRSVEIKNEIVLQDPKEQYLRKILNFGHTLGHAIESFYLESPDKRNLTHGEAIAIGMVCEAYMSSIEFSFDINIVRKIKEVVLDIYGYIKIAKEDYQPILDLLKHDKKNMDGNINFVLLKDLQRCNIDSNTSYSVIKESLEYYNKPLI